MNINYQLFALLNNLEIVKKINPVSVYGDLPLIKNVSNSKSVPLLGLYLPLCKQVSSSLSRLSAACLSILNWNRHLSCLNYTSKQSKHNRPQLRNLHITTCPLQKLFHYAIFQKFFYIFIIH